MYLEPLSGYHHSPKKNLSILYNKIGLGQLVTETKVMFIFFTSEFLQISFWKYFPIQFEIISFTEDCLMSKFSGKFEHLNEAYLNSVNSNNEKETNKVGNH